MAKCPKCHKDDKAQKISGILDEGTVSTTGNTYTFDSHDKGLERLTFDEQETSTFESKSNLVKRFESQIPKEPKRPGNVAVGCGVAAFAYALLQIFLGIELTGNTKEGSYMIMVVAGVFLVFGILRKATGSEKFEERKKAFEKEKAKVLASWYCSRCDFTYLP